ncbi:hypothetical protein BKA70DRAFT_1563181 [Coprinopsis sp. MPI-PUGE-AT-0042]|nr:hypothetical protein BKA70DRAFT_1563181 [Coprinopsis sp. MPI-PUGE-AT-0042]
MISSTGDFTIAFPFSLSTLRTPTPVINQPTSNGQGLSCFVRLNKQPAPAYHYAIAPSIVTSQTHALGLTILAHHEWINNASQFTQNWPSTSGKQESSFRDKPDIGQTKKSKGIAYNMRAFLTIGKVQSISRERRFAIGSTHLDPGGTRVVCEQVEDTVGIHAGDMQRGSVMMGLLDVGPERNQRLNSRHRRHSLLHPPEARTTTMIATNHTSAPLDFLERPSADVEANR